MSAKTGCSECDTEGPWIWLDEYASRDRHYVFHQFGRTLLREMVEPWAIPLIRRLDRIRT